MSRTPYFKLYGSDLVGDTMDLTDAEFGSYVLLIVAMWNAGGYLPNDLGRLCRIARCAPRQWGKRWARLSPFFTVCALGVSNERLLEERKKADALSEIRSHAGERGGKAKALKSKK